MAECWEHQISLGYFKDEINVYIKLLSMVIDRVNVCYIRVDLAIVIIQYLFENFSFCCFIRIAKISKCVVSCLYPLCLDILISVYY